MKKLFPGYYRPSEDEFKQLWDTCVFSFDANVLLNLYRYKDATAKKLIEILTLLRGRLWLPHQVAMEYLNNRIEVISTQRDAYDDIENELSTFVRSLNGALGKYRYHPYIETRRISARIDYLVELLKRELRTSYILHPDLLLDDHIWASITDLFDGSVGEPYTEEELQLKYKQAEQRYGRKIPPGYEDTKKPVPNKYGDYLLWSQLIGFAQAHKKPIVFITGDSKRDWWETHKGKTLGPRPELLQEFRTQTAQQFYIYHTDNFITHAQSYLQLEPTPDIIEEIYDIRSQGSDVVDPYIADIDGDGVDEIVIATSNEIRIFRREGAAMEALEVETVAITGLIEKFFLSDVDNDGKNELVCHLGYDTTFALVFFKKEDGRYNALKMVPENAIDEGYDKFFDAHIMDYDKDGKLEIVCQPWDAIPDDLIPEDYWAAHDRNDPVDGHPWGRVNYVWKWDPELTAFTPIKRELDYIGGR